MLYHSQTNEQGELNLNKFVSIGIIANLTCILRKNLDCFVELDLFLKRFTATNNIMLAKTCEQLHLKHSELDFLLHVQEKTKEKTPTH